MPKKLVPRWLLARYVVAAILLSVIAVAGTILTQRLLEGPAETFAIEPSYAFDVTHLPYLAGYADNVSIARVTGIASVQPPQTVYTLDVQQSLKGSLSGQVTVRQDGYRSGNDVWVDTDQPQLAVGGTYLLVTNPVLDGDGHVLLGGSAASVPLTDLTRTVVVSRYQRAIADQEYPPRVPPKA
jgi:hypothetical protein